MDVKKIKRDFPIFKAHPDLVYLDSTATSLKPKSVIDKLVEYYSHYSANVFRGIYKISEKATKELELTRERVARFINASPEEVVFVRNTTEAINLIAYSLGRKIIDRQSEVAVTIMEHHSNFVPWQQLAFENGAALKVIGINSQGELVFSGEELITNRTKIFAVTMVSNVLGTINPIKEFVRQVRSVNPQTVIVVDAAQSIPHLKVDVQDLGCDFLAFSSHKMLGPTGVGVLWGKKELLEEMFPFQYGGEMIQEVMIERSKFKSAPYKFEAGTPSIGEIIALKEAVDYLENLGMEEIRKHEKKLVDYALRRLKEEFGSDITIFGPTNSEKRSGVVSFKFANFHPHDIAQILDSENICVRAGHHCAMPLHKELGVEATVRASFYIYNDEEDVEKLIAGLKKVEKVLKV